MLFKKFFPNFYRRQILNLSFNLSPLSSNFLYSNSFKRFSTFQHPNQKEDQMNENSQEQIELRDIQKRSRYESAMACLVSGDNKKGLKNLLGLKEDLIHEKQQYSSDYLFLLKKIISVHKFEKENDKIIQVLKEYNQIAIKLYESDLNSLFNEVEYVAINFLNIDPRQAILFLKEIIEDQFFPPFFNHIFLYYLGTAFLLAGKDYGDAIKCLKDSLNSVEDNYLKSCILNNYCCALLWHKSNENIKKLEDVDKIDTVDYAKEVNREMLNIVKQFKETIVLCEGLNVKYDDHIDFDFEIMTSTTDEQKQKIVLNFVLTKNFDLRDNVSVVKELVKIKTSLTKNRISGLIFSNLGEIYFMMKEYKKALVYLNISNLFFNDSDRYDPLYYKNFALLALCDYEINRDFEKAKRMLDKVINIIKHYHGIYEKIFIYRIYSEFLIKNKNTQIIGYEYAEQSEEFEAKTDYFQGRKSYLIVPSVNSEEKQ